MTGEIGAEYNIAPRTAWKSSRRIRGRYLVHQAQVESA